MERTRNKLYVASAVLEFVFASISLLYVLILILGMTSGSFFSSIEADLMIEYAGDTALVQQELEFMKMFSIVMTVFTCISAGVMYVVGAYFIKYSNQTDQEANATWGKCLAWTIVSYFFGGLLIGGLATGGLCSVQAKQRDKFLGKETACEPLVRTAEDNKAGTATQNKEDMLSPENLDKLKLRLEKLKELKDSGAISEEEFNNLRARVMNKELPKTEEKPVDQETIKLNKMQERLNKLKELKEAGALTEEEYQNLRDKVVNETK